MIPGEELPRLSFPQTGALVSWFAIDQGMSPDLYGRFSRDEVPPGVQDP